MNKKIIAGIMSVAMLATMSATPIYATEGVGDAGTSQSGTSDTIQQNTLPEDKTYPSQDAGQTTTLKAKWNKQDKTLTFSSSKQDGEELTKGFVEKAYYDIGLSHNQFGENGNFTLVIGEGITKIGDKAFSGAGRDHAFNYLNWKNIGALKFTSDEYKTNTSLQTIGEFAFFSSKIKNLDLSKCENFKKIETGAFQMSNISTINFNSNIEEIGNSAFTCCEHLKEVNFEGCNSLKSLDNFAFNHCGLLEKVSFKNCINLEKTGCNLFQECEMLETVDFTGCKNLESIGISTTEFEGISSFDRCPKLKNVILTGCINLTTIHEDTFNTAKSINLVTPIVDITGANTGLSENPYFKDIIIKRDNAYTVKGDVTLNQPKLEINDGETLTIRTDANLTIPNDKTLTNNGIVTNSGTVINNGTLTNNKTMTNAGTLTNNKTITNSENGTIDNKGTINTGKTTEQDEGAAPEFTNNGTINKHSGSNIKGEETIGGETGKIETILPPEPDTTPDNKPSYDYEPTPDIIVDTSTDDFADGGNVNISGFDGVPDDLKTKYGSVRDMMKYTKQAIAEYFEKAFKNIKFNADNTVFFNAELKPDADGKIYLPIPKNVDATKNKFVVAHIMKDGDIEVVEGKVTENGIEVKLNGLSPVMITWFSSDLSAGEGMVEVEESL